MRFKLLVYGIFAVAAVLLGFVAVTFNSQIVQLDLVFKPVFDITAGTLMVSSFVLGGFFGLLIGSGLPGRLRRSTELRKLRQQVQRQANEIDTLRIHQLKP